MSDKNKSLLFLAVQIVVPWLLLLAAVGGYFGYLSAEPVTQLWVIRVTSAVVALIGLANILPPHYLVWFKTQGVPKEHKIKASLSMIESQARGVFQIPFSVSAFFVVPIVMLFVKREDDRLPGIFELLYGDKNGLDGDNVLWVVANYGPIGPNGEDVWDGKRVPPPLNPTPEEAKAMADLSYFPGLIQRTYAYRVLWLLRNRSTKLAEKLGVTLKNFSEYSYWGPATKIDADKGLFGCYLMEHDGNYEVAQLAPAGMLFGKWPIVLRQRYGYKLANETGPFVTHATYVRRAEVEVINIAYSWKGYDLVDNPTEPEYVHLVGHLPVQHHPV